MGVQGDNSLFFATGLDNSGLRNGKIDAVNIIKSLGSEISKINPFAALAIGAITAFAKISNEAFKMSRDFESAMAEVKTIANVSKEEFKELENSVFDIYKRLGTEPPDKLANGLYEIIGAGFEASDALKILEISTKAATAGVTETAVASDGLTTILNAFRLSSEDAQQVADIMFATVDRGKISFQELSSQIAVVAPLAASSNISFEEVGAAISTLTKQGVPAGSAMTQIRSAIISANEVLGEGAFKTLSLQEGLQKMFETAGGSQNKLKELAGRIEAVNGIIGIAGDNFKGASDDLDAMANSAGSVERSFKTITSTNINQWEIFRNKIKATTKDIGDAVLDMSNNFIGSLNKVIDRNNTLSKSLENERSELRVLELKIKDINTTNDDRVNLINKLKSLYPEFLSDINAETISNERLSQSIEKINKSLINKIVLQRKEEEINDARENAADKLETALEREEKLRKLIGDAIVNNNLKVKEGLSLSEQARDVLNQLPDSGGVLSEQGKIRLALRNFEFSSSFSETAQNLISKLEKEKKELSLKLGIKIDENEINDIDEETKKVIDKINAITSEQYRKNKSILKEFLESENELISNAALKRKKFFDFKPANSSDKDDRSEDEKFEDNLMLKEEQYKHYTLALKNEDKQFAKELRENYKLKEEDYISYLRNLYSITKSEGSKVLILDALDKQGSGLNPRQKAKTLPSLKTSPIVLDIKLNTKSIQSIRRRLNKLTSDYEKAQTDAERKLISEKIKAENKKLEAAERHLKGEKDLYNDLHKNISDLSINELRNRIDNKKRELNEKLKDEKKYTEEILKLKGEIENAERELSNKIQFQFDRFSGYFSQLSSLFQKFGDNEISGLLSQLSGVASGIGRIASGDIFGGALGVLDSVITVEVVSDTGKFLNAIKELEKAIDKLDFVISKSVGNDKIGNRREAIEDLEALEAQAEQAYEAEKRARKEVRFLGVKLWNKGKGSGTDPAKLEELERKAEEARRKAEELKDQLDELYTGTTQETIVDSIISGLKEGKRSVADFANNFKDLMQDALLQAFQIKYLEKEIEKFYDAFSEAGSDQNYSAQEIESLRELYDAMINGAQQDLDAINQILEDTGIGAIGSQNNEGLSGAISQITEDTANILAGTLNSIRIDISNGLEIAQKNTEYLSSIASNTSYNRLLEDISIAMKDINSKL